MGPGGRSLADQRVDVLDATDSGSNRFGHLGVRMDKFKGSLSEKWLFFSLQLRLKTLFKHEASYRAPLAVGSYWSPEHPLDAPQLSVTQVGGTDHDVVARHWTRRFS